MKGFRTSCSFSSPELSCRKGGLRQEAVRRARSRARLSVALHPPRRHRQQPPDRPRPQRRHLQVEGLSDRRPRSIQNHDAGNIDEFIRRFLIHVLPRSFHRIRHYGLLAKTSGADNIALARELLATPKPQSQPAEADAANPSEPACPFCGGRMLLIETFERGRTPRHQPTGPMNAIRIDTS